MRKLTIFLLVIIGINQLSQANVPTRKVLFDNNWHFYKGNIKNGEKPDFDDSSWRIVNLPHDWSIEPLPKQLPDTVVGPFSRASVGGFATGNFIGGEGWYRKSFVLSEEESEQRVELYFEGIYNQSEVWVNGKKANTNVYGYSSFRFDISPYCMPAGEENIIAVRVRNEGKNSRWYSGSGIYRHVWLLKTSQSYIEDWGTFVRTLKIENEQAEILLTTSVVNSKEQDQDFLLEVELLSPKSDVVARSSLDIQLPAGNRNDFTFNMQVVNPSLWGCESPNLYSARIRLIKDKTYVDELEVPFGIRTINFSVEKGFELNNKPLYLKGGCVHHDNGLLGSAAFDDAEERKIRLLKENGFNAVRVAHNPMSESFMNACDRLGVLVIDEAFDQWNRSKNPNDYHQYFKEWSAQDIKTLVLRDRNHPSVIMWSIGNEIRERITEEGKETAEYLKNEILKYDNTRPITAGVNKFWNEDRTEMLPLDNALYHLDVLGYNYMWRFFEEEHEKYPNHLIFSSESVATEAAQNWSKVEMLPYVIGDFVWTAMDYLGESGLGNTLEVDPQENVHQFMEWPWFNGWCGDIDLIGTKKAQSYYRDILWREKEISMAVELPVTEGKIRKVSFWGWPEEILSWTFPGMENKNVTVNVYSRIPKVKLYLNNKLIGEQNVNEFYMATFKVPYQPGELKAVAVSSEGEISSVNFKTTGKPHALRLKADKDKMKANGQDLSYVLIELVDCNGNVIKNNDQKIAINCIGKGSIIGSGNASPTDMQSFGSLQPNLFKGRAMVIIRSGMKAGEIKLTVSSSDLPSSSINLQTN